MKSPDMNAEWWTTTDVAAYLHVRTQTVSSYRVRDQMPEPDMRVGRTHLWRPTRIIEWTKTRKKGTRRELPGDL